MEIIKSLDNKKIKSLRKLKEKKYRDKEGLFLVEGIHLVLEAYKTNNLEEVILEENEVLPFDINTTYTTYEVIKSLSSLDTPYKVIGVCKKQKEEKNLGDKILVLDDIQDPGNLGTIIRSSVSFNVDTIVLSNNTVDLYNQKVLRSSQGMNFHINIIRRDLFDFITDLKKEDYTIYGTDVENGIDVKNIKSTSKCAIIMGNEGNGVKREIKELCDENIYIKMNDNCESLNVSVSASIILYELNK